MSGHTNRNRRNGGNPRSRHSPQRQRGSDGRSGQPKNGVPPSSEQESKQESRASESKTTHEHIAPPSVPPPPAQPELPPATASQDQPSTFDDAEPPGELEIPPERPESGNPRGRFPPAASMRGGHAYIPASGLRPSANGQNGQNGHRSANGYVVERRTGPPVSPGDDDEGDDAGMGSTPKTWRIERLNGGSDTTPRESIRPESRGEMGPLIDSLHELFAQDRMVASQGDVTRCGICYLHFPLIALEYRGAEGFYVCAGCKRTLGHQQLMMVRRQQPPRNG